MNIEEFKKKLDNRGPFSYDDMWPFALKWQEKINEQPVNENIEWRWDCNLKLDYDGSLLTISSRFYPPHKSHVDYGKYSGSVELYFSEYKTDKSNTLLRKEIESETLDGLVHETECLVGKIQHLCRSILFQNKDRFSNL